MSPFLSVLGNSFASLYVILIFVGPIILGFMCMTAFVEYKRNAFIQEKLGEAQLLEITLPKEIMKSPQAMELFLTAVYQTSGETTFIDTVFLGKTRTWYSLEIASFAGELKFYIWTMSFWKPIVTSYLYAQYPEIEIREVPDYAKGISYDKKKNDIFGIEYTLTKPSIYPIKTYVDFGLDKDPKEEYKIDPVTLLLEYMSNNVGVDQQLWLQIIVRAHKGARREPGNWAGREDWKGAAAAEIKKLKTQDIQEAGEIKISGVNLTRGEKDVIEAIERNVSKLAYDCVIRSVYIAPKDKFQDINKVGLIALLRQFNTGNLNSFGISYEHSTVFDYPWEDFHDIRLDKKKHHILHAYQERAAFHFPHRSHAFVLNTESLATIYHFPGSNAKTPSLARVAAKKSEAPANLPI
ncbi:MAG: hypothetical protein V4438_03765 [Patescibacteria group bacterium]